MSNSTTSDFIDFTELSFDDLKDQLINYISSQSEFTDANIQGSNFNLLTELLAYVTEILSFNLNNNINEKFLNTAQLRSNILKTIKALNYTPFRKQSSTIYLDLNVPYDASKRDYYLKKYDSVKAGDYIFYYLGEDKYPSVFTNSSTGQKFLKYSECLFKEGQLFISDASEFSIREGDDINETGEFYSGDGSNFQKFDIFDLEVGDHLRILQNKNNTIIEWDLFDEKDEYVNAGEANIFFLEETDKSYKINFGNNKLGVTPLSSDSIGYLYIRPSGAEANELTNFEFNNGVFLSADDFGTTGFIEPPDGDDFVQQSYGGREKETIDEIKFTAPKFFNTQSRAVTEDDYHTLAVQHPLVEKANVIGGQKVVSTQTSGKMLGKVYIYVKPDLDNYPSLNFTDNILDNTLKDYFKQFSVVTIDPIVNNVSYIHYRPYIELKYKNDVAPDTETVKDGLVTYMNDEQGRFGEYFEESQFVDKIDDLDIRINSVVFHSEKYVELKNGSYTDDPNNYEFKTTTIPELSTGIFKLVLTNNLQKWKIDYRQTITGKEYNLLDYDPDGNALSETSETEIANPWYGRRVPATRLETYEIKNVNNTATETLVHIAFPFNHPGIESEDLETGETQKLKYYRLMYGENPTVDNGEFFPEEAGDGSGVPESTYKLDPTVDYYSPIFDWEEEEFNYGVTIDSTEYTRPTENTPGKNGNLTLYAGTEFVSDTGNPQITNSFPKLDFSDFQNFEDEYPHNIVSFIPHIQDQDVVSQNSNYRFHDYWFVMGEEVSTGNTIKYKETYVDASGNPDADGYYMKLYLGENDTITINQFNFNNDADEVTTLTNVSDNGDLFSSVLDTGEQLENYYCLINTPSFKQNMLFKIVEIGKEKYVTSEGSKEEYSIKVLGENFDAGSVSYITFTTINAAGTKTDYVLWFNQGGQSEPSISGTKIEVDVSDTGLDKTNIANAIDAAITQTGELVGIDYDTGGYNYDGVDTITIVNEGNGTLLTSEKIDTNDFSTFELTRNAVGSDDELSDTQLVYVKLEHISDENARSTYETGQEEIEKKLIYHNENYISDPQTGEEYKLDEEANLLEDFDEVRPDQTFSVYRRVLYNTDGDGLPDLIPDPTDTTSTIENSDLEDGELIEVIGLQEDFNGIYRIASDGDPNTDYGFSYNWIKTDIKSDNDEINATKFSSEIPYLTGNYTLELPAKLNKEPKKIHRFYFEVEENDLFLQRDQILNLYEKDVEIVNTKVSVT
jgi:hypothetical protein